MIRVLAAGPVILLWPLMMACSGEPQLPPNPPLPYGFEIPRDLEEAVNQLENGLPESEKSIIRELDEDTFAANSHFGLGMTLRNNWGLWKGSRLRDFFNEHGIHHPDDMSAIITTSLWRRLHGKPIDLDGQVACFQRWWEELQRNKEDSIRRGDNVVFHPTFSCPSGRPLPQPLSPQRPGNRLGDGPTTR